MMIDDGDGSATDRRQYNISIYYYTIVPKYLIILGF